jgi:hypothetical protein
MTFLVSFRADAEDIAEVDAATYEAVPFTADELALEPRRRVGSR